MEGMRRVDEWGRLCEQLPSADHDLRDRPRAAAGATQRDPRRAERHPSTVRRQANPRGRRRRLAVRGSFDAVDDHEAVLRRPSRASARRSRTIDHERRCHSPNRSRGRPGPISRCTGCRRGGGCGFGRDHGAPAAASGKLEEPGLALVEWPDGGGARVGVDQRESAAASPRRGAGGGSPFTADSGGTAYLRPDEHHSAVSASARPRRSRGVGAALRRRFRPDAASAGDPASGAANKRCAGWRRKE